MSSWKTKAADILHRTVILGLFGVTCVGAYTVATGSYFIINKRIQMTNAAKAAASANNNMEDSNSSNPLTPEQIVVAAIKNVEATPTNK